MQLSFTSIAAIAASVIAAPALAAPTVVAPSPSASIAASADITGSIENAIDAFKNGVNSFATATPSSGSFGSEASSISETLAELLKLKIDFSVHKSSLLNHPHHKGSSTRQKLANQNKNVSLTLENEYSMYVAEIEIGTPGQKVEVAVDTGSSDLWVPAAGTQSDYGTYNNSKSLTYQKYKDGFHVSYGDGTGAQGDWATETVQFGNIKVENLTFGDATQQTAGSGILGIGLKGNEASKRRAYSSSSSGFTYDNYPYQLKNQGIIKRVAYSLYLNAQNASSGSVLFGAIDHEKYTGDKLTQLDLVKIDDGGDAVTGDPVAFFINLNNIASSQNSFSNRSSPALLDSGTTLVYAPSDVVTAVGSRYGTYSSALQGYTAPCDTQGEDFQFSFDNGATITVPFKDLLYKTTSTSSTCLVGFVDSGEDYYILGDAFLRSAYVYYDLESYKISIGQVQYSLESDIELVN